MQYIYATFIIDLFQSNLINVCNYMFAYVSADVPSRVHSLDKTKKKKHACKLTRKSVKCKHKITWKWIRIIYISMPFFMMAVMVFPVFCMLIMGMCHAVPTTSYSRADGWYAWIESNGNFQVTIILQWAGVYLFVPVGSVKVHEHHHRFCWCSRHHHTLNMTNLDFDSEILHKKQRKMLQNNNKISEIPMSTKNELNGFRIKFHFNFGLNRRNHDQKCDLIT